MVRLILPMKRERFAASLILVAFVSGMILTAATSGCDSADYTAQVDSGELHVTIVGARHCNSTDSSAMHSVPDVAEASR